MKDTIDITALSSTWQRTDFSGTPIYIHTGDAGWFVPNTRGDLVLKDLMSGKDVPEDTETRLFLSGLPTGRKEPYNGRNETRNPLALKELWFHVTNRCNLSCTHCLFSSSPSDDRSLSLEMITGIAEEAYENGVRLFALTGGEPLVHPEIDGIVSALLAFPGCHVAMLTNGMTLVPFMDRVQPDPSYFHVQISVDGLRENHDRIRSAGTFDKLSTTLLQLKERSFPFTLSMCVTRDNMNDMPGFVDFAVDHGASNVHFMWYFVKGRGETGQAPDLESVFEKMAEASERAETRKITIDNLESLKTQVFAPPGTIHDGSSAGWESLAVGPDGNIYPSASLVGTPGLKSALSGSVIRCLEESPVLRAIRSESIVTRNSLFRHLLGGGDLDHSFVHKGTFMGDDPYQDLHEKLAAFLISKEAGQWKNGGESPSVILQMGDILESCGARGDVAFVHSNCLLAASGNHSLTSVKDFYSAAVGDTKKDILNPVCYDSSLLSHIPEKFRFRGYGCGSPVLDAGIEAGDRVADLGCGSGVECFIAAKLCGKTGSVIGVDMLDPMLALAEQAKPHVEKNMGYENLSFRKGYLENLPLADGSVDIVTSNCVMNLSVNKRKAYAEIFRSLRPGGKLVISDVVCETDPGPAIRNDETLKGECIGGALTESRLMVLLRLSGFRHIRLVKRFPYRTVGGHAFYSLTYQAVKPKGTPSVNVMYRGPLPYLTGHDGNVLPIGKAVAVTDHDAENLGDQVFVFDHEGVVRNIQAENSCACFKPPEQKTVITILAQIPEKHTENCMACGSPLVYEKLEKDAACHFCGKTFKANAACEKGHFVCDRCHAGDGLAVIRHIAVETKESDMIRLFEQIRNHPSIPMHGPEYHSLVPAVILSCYRNSGGEIGDDVILTGIERGSTVAGGFCGFMGICGAAVGVGAAFSLILESNPYKGKERRTVQNVTRDVLSSIADLEAARCCQRDGYIALIKAAELSLEILGVELKADDKLVCGQWHKNKECPGNVCPLFVKKERLVF
jgi:MoaA/NifB/PqqE/SkfB family radical SAM enzyme/SAM-dependent methyltransferase